MVAIAGSEEGGYYRCVISRGQLLSFEKSEHTVKNTEDLEQKYRDIVFSTTPGRSWLAEPFCEAELADGSMLVGTKAGTLAIVSGEKVFNLGCVTTAGCVRALSASPDGRTVYGVAGDEDDLGLIFSYSMEAGIVNHGCIYFESASGE